MSRTLQFIGILGIASLFFGLVSNLLVAYDEYYLGPAHLTVAGFCLVLFIIRGGLQLLKTVTARRAAGFGAGVTLYSIVFVGILVLLNYFASKHDFLQYDSTEAQVYTLAPQTIEVLSSLKEPIMARAFFLGKVDPDTESLLNRFEKASDKFHWTWIDPEKKPALMDKFGISQAKTIHLSFDTEPSPRETRVTHDLNEQELVNGLLKLSRENSKIVYYVSGHGEADLNEASDAGFLFLKEAIEGENLQVKKLVVEEQGSIPADCASLLLMAPRKALLPNEHAAVEDYLKRGGNAVFLYEPRTTDEIADLVRPLGITVGKDLVVDQVVRMFAGPGLGVQPMVTQYGDHVTTKDLTEGTVYSTVSSVSRAANIPEGADLTELAFTSANSWAEKDLEKLYSEKPVAARDPDDLRGPVPIAVAFEGPYPKGRFLKASELATAPEPVVEDIKKSRVVVLGDVDFVANVNLRQLYNADFFLNLLNWTLDQKHGITIRARNMRRSVKVLSEDQFGSIFILSGILFPELLIAAGVGIWLSRRQ